MAKLFGSRILSLRENKGWSQDDLERESGVAQAHISRLETGKSPNVSAVILGQLADALGTSLDYLAGRTDNPSACPATVNHPLLKDPLFHDFLALWPRLDDEGRKILLDIAGLMATKAERRGKE